MRVVWDLKKEGGADHLEPTIMARGDRRMSSLMITY